MTYKAINRQTAEVRQGSFDELCDLDKRIWELVEDDWQYEPTELCTLLVTAVVTLFLEPHQVKVLRYHIYSLEDLVGIYLN